MRNTVHRTTRPPVGRRLAATAVALGSCLALAVPVGTAQAAAADPVPTVFFGDSYTSNFGIAPFQQDDTKRIFCFQAKENYPAAATRRLAVKGITLDVQSDVSCGGALVKDFWSEQQLPTGSLPPQQDAFKADTRLAVGSMGGNTLGFPSILKQCSDKLRDHALLPGEPVDPDEPAARCSEFFSSGDGKAWLDWRFETVKEELEEMLTRMVYVSPEADTVLVGYPRIVPADTAKCQTPAPGQKELPLADIPADALPVLDQIQNRLNDVMKEAATAEGAAFVDLYGHTGDNTACDGVNRGIGGLLEDSQLNLGGEQSIPWYAHPSERGRDIQAEQVAAKVEQILNP
ncbi:SGNH/GDSL hydrolase family protein [Streptomyces sp. CLV115]|uniref:SGNH/GDSL hydrolase family protein n=1 Tax=Streptomyces sp. CLV115 TaxID=3138502 RepID=UPI00313EDB41